MESENKLVLISKGHHRLQLISGQTIETSPVHVFHNVLSDGHVMIYSTPHLPKWMTLSGLAGSVDDVKPINEKNRAKGAVSLDFQMRAATA